METEALEILHIYWRDFLLLLPKLVAGIIIFLVFIFIAGRVFSLLNKRLQNRIKDELLSTFISKIVKWFIITVGFIFLMQTIGLAAIAGGMFAGAGVAAFIIGFAFKDIGENFLAGIILAFNRPFSIGDIIVTQNISGTVTSFDLRTTNIKTFEGHDIYIPNSVILNNPLTNFNADSLRRHEFVVGIDYSSNIGNAIAIISDLLANNEEVLKQPEPEVLVNELADSSINLVVKFWFDSLQLKRNWMRAKSDIVKNTKEALDKAGIDIPFPIVQLQMHEPGKPITLETIQVEDQKK